MQSIYDFICESLDDKGFLPKGEPLKLPDHDNLDAEVRENWVAGEFEAVMVRLPYPMKEMSFVNYFIARTVAACIKNPCEKNREKFNAKLKKYATVSIADPVLSFLSRMNIDKASAAEFARGLIKESSERAFVKFGIVLLGYYGSAEDCDLVSLVGIHEEFTFYSVKALRNLDKSADFQRKLLEIAERTGGWGKIAAILEFPDDGLSDDTRMWLLKSGCANSVGLHFTACECAIKGGLKTYLASCVENQSNIPCDVTDGICDILEGLAKGSTLKDGDGFNEVPGMESIAANLRWLLENDAFEGDKERIKNSVQGYK